MSTAELHAPRATAHRVQADRYNAVRQHTRALCSPLAVEDHVVQPADFVSPPKWHLGHTTWFFEQFMLGKRPGYKLFSPDMAYMFNSYYETVGKHVLRAHRGNMSRPTLQQVLDYRDHVDRAMQELLAMETLGPEQQYVLEVGLNHEQQHQELLLTDIKYILGNNPLFPAYGPFAEGHAEEGPAAWVPISGGVQHIGHTGEGFCYDNELRRHPVMLEDHAISTRVVTNGEYLEFMQDGGYREVALWHSDGWQWLLDHGVQAPMYWHRTDGLWQHYTLQGLKPVDPALPLAHISFYEAAAYAQWKGCRLPTEAEWEADSGHFNWGQRWEWTNSAYLPYPGFAAPKGALGEYNAKFMVDQMVLRGASVATPPGHSRASYRNFFQPFHRWQYTGIRLAKNM